MNQLSQKDLEQIISLYIDGELDIHESKKFEEYLANHPVTAREVEILRSAKKTFASKKLLTKNDWFWLKLHNRLEENARHSTASQLNKRPMLSYISLAAATALVIGFIYFKDAPMFHQFFRDKKQQVEDVYRNNIMTGNILPLFENLNKEDILNFALFGSIAIDSSQTTSLQVRNTEDKGTQIEFVRNNAPHTQPVSMKDFASELGISRHQKELVDSILGSYKERLRTSVLVSENDEVAVHAELVDLNRAMVSTIAACLEPVQRTRFQRFLENRNAPYAVVAVNAPKIPSNELFGSIPTISRSNNYVVITSDTVGIAEVQIAPPAPEEMPLPRALTGRRIMTERMLSELMERQRRMEERMVMIGESRVRVHSSGGAFQIHFEHSRPEIAGSESVEMVRPRLRSPEAPRALIDRVTVVGDSGFAFELPADHEAVRVFKRLPRGEFRFEIVDSVMHEPRVKLMFRSPKKKQEFETKLREMKEREQDLLDLDSLLRESEKQIDQPPTKPKKSGREIEVEVMM